LTDDIAVCRGVEVVYRRGGEVVHALAGVDLTVERHDSLALLGRSGSGKTTLLHVLGGLVTPTGGQVERPAVGIAYVFQGSNLLPHFTAIENVAFARHVASGEIDSSLDPRELLELVGLSGKAGNLPAELSGGEAQRVAIARALSQEPQLLLCDEPTGHLDSDTGGRVLDLIDALQRELAFALVVATHDTDVAQRLRRSVELHDGRVVTGAVV
jgi:putative ABC transport system ATP-binding protein